MSCSELMPCAQVQDELSSRNSEMYHMRPPGRALSEDELMQLHQVDARLWLDQAANPEAAVSLPTQMRSDAVLAFKNMLACTKQHMPHTGRRALQMARAALSDMQVTVTQTIPASVTGSLSSAQVCACDARAHRMCRSS